MDSYFIMRKFFSCLLIAFADAREIAWCSYFVELWEFLEEIFTNFFSVLFWSKTSNLQKNPPTKPTSANLTSWKVNNKNSTSSILNYHISKGRDFTFILSSLWFQSHKILNFNQYHFQFFHSFLLLFFFIFTMFSAVEHNKYDRINCMKWIFNMHLFLFITSLWILSFLNESIICGINVRE